MLRKNIRLRREYLFHRENEKNLTEKYEKKQKLKNAINGRKMIKLYYNFIEKKSIPSELVREQDALKKSLQMDDDTTLIPRSHIDDEYSQIYLKYPKILITTSRNSSSRLTNFLKEMSLLIPNSTRINRGAYVIKDLVDMSVSKDFTDLIILHEHRGEPDGMIISHMPLGPTLFLGIQNCVLRHDLKEKPDTMSEAFPHLIFDGFSTKIGERITNIIKHLFPAPKADSKRILTFSNNSDIIQFRHHDYQKTDYKTVELNEIGPRFDLKPFQIILGTLNQPEAPKEWVLRPHMNTANKRKAF